MVDDRDRRTAIADGAIAIVGERGIRALTHRAIDQRLGLPAGSTSYYLRTRRALLEAMVNRLAERTTADLQAVADAGRGRPVAALLDATADAAAATLDRMLTERRQETLARYALTLELATDPALHRILAAGGPIRAFAEQALAGLGAQDPARDAADLVSFADGLVFDRLVGTRSLSGPQPGSPASRAELARALQTFLRGALTG